MFEGFSPRQDLVGFTAIPNEFFDEVIAEIDNLAEMKIVQAVFRQTYGYIRQDGGEGFKREDEISYKRFKQLTGLSSASIAEGIKRAIEDGYIIRVKEGERGGTSAVYKIRNKDEEKQEVKRGGDSEMGVDKFIPDEKPYKLSKKEEEVDEINYDKEQEGNKKKSQYQKYKEKSVEDFHTNDVCFYFRDKYEKHLETKFGKITNKDRGQIKKLLDEYGVNHVLDAIDHLMKNYREYIDGYPSIQVLYGFRKTIFPAVVQGKSKKYDVTQPKVSEEEAIEKSRKESAVGWE